MARGLRGNGRPVRTPLDIQRAVLAHLAHARQHANMAVEPWQVAPFEMSVDEARELVRFYGEGRDDIADLDKWTEDFLATMLRQMRIHGVQLRIKG